jgi:hypothetical protein
MKTTKQTAANNKFLAAVKKLMNHKIYAETARLMNVDGQDTAVVYLQQFSTNSITAESFIAHVDAMFRYRGSQFK